MNRAPHEPYRPFRREDGILARIDENGDELRMHRDGRGFWHAHRWRADPTSHDGWRGPVAFGFTPADLVALGGAALALPVADAPPAASGAER